MTVSSGSKTTALVALVSILGGILIGAIPILIGVTNSPSREEIVQLVDESEQRTGKRIDEFAVELAALEAGQDEQLRAMALIQTEIARMRQQFEDAILVLTESQNP